MPPLPKSGERSSKRSLGVRALFNARMNRTTLDTSSLASTSADASAPQELANEPPAALGELDPIATWRENVSSGSGSSGSNREELMAPPDWNNEDEDEARDLVTPIIHLGVTMGIQENHEVVHDFISDDQANDDGLPIPESSNDDYMPAPSRSGSTSVIARLRPNIAFSRAESIASNWSHVLHHYAPRFEYTLEEWGDKIRNSSSLRSTKILRVVRYRQKTGLRHRFLVFRLQRDNKSRNIYLRLDRRPVAGFNPVKFLFTSGVTTANDCALLSADEGRAIRGNASSDISILETTLTFPDSQFQPTLSHLECILVAIGVNMKQYKLTSENCWFFCSIFLESLSLVFKGAVAGDPLEHAGLPAVPALRTSIYKHITERLPPLPTPSLSLPQPPSPLEPLPSVTSLPPRLPFSPSLPSPSSSSPSSPSSLHSPPPSPVPETKPESEPESRPALFPQLSRTISVGSAMAAVAVHPSGDRIVSTSSGYTAQLWDAATGEAIGKPLEGHTDSVWSVAFSPDGRQIATGSLDRTIRIWDAMSGAVIGEPLQGHSRWIGSVTFSPDGWHIASGSGDKTIRLWDALTGATVGKPFVGHTSDVNSVSFSPDSQHIASASDDMTIRLWDAATGVSIGEPFRGHTEWVQLVAFSPDGQFIASGSSDKTICLWDTTGNLVRTLNGHTFPVFSVTFSPDGQYIASGSVDETVRIWDVKTGDVVGEPLGGNTRTGTVRSVAFFPDGRRLASGSDDKTIRIWDLSV